MTVADAIDLGGESRYGVRSLAVSVLRVQNGVFTIADVPLFVAEARRLFVVPGDILVPIGGSADQLPDRKFYTDLLAGVQAEVGRTTVGEEDSVVYVLGVDGKVTAVRYRENLTFGDVAAPSIGLGSKTAVFKAMVFRREADSDRRITLGLPIAEWWAMFPLVHGDIITLASESR